MGAAALVFQILTAELLITEISEMQVLFCFVARAAMGDFSFPCTPCIVLSMSMNERMKIFKIVSGQCN